MFECYCKVFIRDENDTMQWRDYFGSNILEKVRG